MSYYDDSYHESNDLKSMLKIKAVELFRQCDKEDKGFINKRDIQRMKEPLGLSPDLLEEVFESLDIDGNGYLTLDEFTAGFSSYLGTSFDDNDESVRNSSGFNEDLEEEESAFRETMESLGAASLIDAESNIKELWMKLKNEDPSMRRSFESFIGSVCQELIKSKTDYSILETALQNKSMSYNEEVRRLYEEMESQLKSEKARAIELEAQRERELREKLERELGDKEKYLQESLSRQNEMEQKLFNLNLVEYRQKQENEKLLKEKAMLEEQLNESVKHLKSSKTYIDTLQKQTKEEKINRVKQTLKVTENIVSERENLMKELEMLKEMNKRLQDERDELALQTTSLSNNEELRRKNSIMQHYDGRQRLSKQGSVMSNYIKPVSNMSIEMDDPMQIDSVSQISHPLQASFQEPRGFTQFSYNNVSSKSHEDVESGDRVSSMSTKEGLKEPLSKKLSERSTDFVNVPSNATPQRVFKIVLIGDSGVGKTSFVQRFCNNSFRESFSTTIGVDFQVKTIKLDNRIIALQLWDTAGQERYRSITKQYFRKADGVICMYDVTSEHSFKNLRNWITSLKESADEDCLLTIIGNKIDLCESEDARVIKYKNGSVIADEQGALFFETSSRTGNNIIEAMEAIVRILQEKEDKQIEDVLNLKTKENKSGCCSFK